MCIRDSTKSIPALKMTLALVCYSLAFSLLAAMAFSGSFALPASYLAEPVCIVVLAGVYILYAQFAKDAAKPYVLYRAVAPSMGPVSYTHLKCRRQARGPWLPQHCELA